MHPMPRPKPHVNPMPHQKLQVHPKPHLTQLTNLSLQPYLKSDVHTKPNSKMQAYPYYSKAAALKRHAYPIQ